MRRVDHGHLDFPEGGRVLFHGRYFTGQAITRGKEEITARTFVDGIEQGPEISWNGHGQLISLGYVSAGGMPVGPLHHWDAEGALALEHVNDPYGNQRVTRRWEASGRLIGEERFDGFDAETGREVLPPWQTIRLSPDMEAAGHETFLPATDIDELGVGEADGVGPLVLLGEVPFTGEAVTRDDLGRVEMHTFVEGVEDGPTLAWSSSGALLVQGITRYPHGPVGPWHEWDEEGRLLRETVHDALGNRIIVRELDAAGDIAREVRTPPARPARDPRTGEERPAPWL